MVSECVLIAFAFSGEWCGCDLWRVAAGEATPRELADTFGLTQQNVSKHLQVLHRSGVVARRPDRSNVFCRLADDSTARLLDDVLSGSGETPDSNRGHPDFSRGPKPL
jgi:DNA-binding transcriptional ArsR family regulator